MDDALSHKSKKMVNKQAEASEEKSGSKKRNGKQATSALTASPTAVSRSKIRPPAVAGSWYPDDSHKLAEMVDRMLAGAAPVNGSPVALVVPHASYLFSGPIAASGFKQLQGETYDVAIIIGTDHHPPLSQPISVWAEGGFETPLGVVPVDEETAQALVATDFRILADPAAHAAEHAIEMQLPFLQRVCPHCPIVPILMSTDDEETVAALAKALLSVLGGKKAVVIASSDLSHDAQQAAAVRVDQATLAAMESGHAGMVRKAIAASMAANVPGLTTCACGLGPILVTMRVAQELGANITTLLNYASSANAPHGDTERVVGYGAMMFWHYHPPLLTAAARKELLALARTTIAQYLQTGNIPPYQTDDAALNQRAGVFVTLKKQVSQSDSASALLAPEWILRGCTGRVWGTLPLYQAVQETAVSAATTDPRFPPLHIGELEKIHIEISVLSPLRRLTDIRQIEIGKHGLVILSKGRQGLLLPQVPLTRGWGREQFLENLCRKAGLLPDEWRRGATLYTFSAIVFGEET